MAAAAASRSRFRRAVAAPGSSPATELLAREAPMDGVTDGRGRAGAGEADGRADDLLRARARDSGSESSLSGSDGRSIVEPRRRFWAGVDAFPPPGAGEFDGGLAGGLGLGRALTLGGGSLN